MQNYVIRFKPADRETVLNILSRSNDIIINHVETENVGITIQLDESDAAYEALLAQIEGELEPEKEIVIVKVDPIL